MQRRGERVRGVGPGEAEHRGRSDGRPHRVAPEADQRHHDRRRGVPAAASTQRAWRCAIRPRSPAIEDDGGDNHGVAPWREALFEPEIQNRDEVFVTFDGQAGHELQAGDEVIVCRAPTSLRLIRPSTRSYFEVLREKLKWGEH